MRNGCCLCSFEKLPEGWSRRGKTLVDVCARGGIVVAVALVCARQRPRQFPLRPYRCLHSEVSRGPDIPRPAETLMRTEVVLPDQPGGTNM